MIPQMEQFSTIGTNDALEVGVPSVDRALDVLELLEASDGRLTLTEIANRLDLPKGSAHRLLTTLRGRGYVAAQGGNSGNGRGGGRGGYVLGPRLVALGARSQERLDVVRLAREPMRRLAEATGEGCQLSIRSGRQAVCIARVASPSHPEIALTGGIGAAFPLYAVAVGKALLAFAPESEQRAVAESGLTAYTPNTLVGPSALLTDLAAIRRDGIARDEQEYKLGLRALAAPVFDAAGNVVAALALPLLVLGQGDEAAESNRIAALRAASAAVSHALGFQERRGF
jgi:DNA-binding IclR family transcriptional regulator